MIPLMLSTLFSAGFAVCIRFAQKRGANQTIVGAVNYLSAALFHLVLALLRGAHAPRQQSILIGVGGGIAYATAFFLLQGLMKRRGVSVTAAIMRLSVLVPVGVSFLAWNETASAVQAVGIGLAVLSLPLLSIGPAEPREGANGERHVRGQSVALLAGLFVVNGLCLLATRAFRQTGIKGEDSAFLFILFATASLVACGAWVVQAARRRGGHDPGRAVAAPRIRFAASAGPGLVVGLCNALANLFLVIALQRVPGIIVYPFYSAVGLLATVAATRLIWKERLGPLEAAGMALAGGSIVLINLV